MCRPHGVALIEGDEGPEMLAGADTGIAGAGSQAAEVGVVFSKQFGAADHCHWCQHKCRVAQHVRLSLRAGMCIALSLKVWRSGAGIIACSTGGSRPSSSEEYSMCSSVATVHVSTRAANQQRLDSPSELLCS